MEEIMHWQLVQSYSRNLPDELMNLWPESTKPRHYHQMWDKLSISLLQRQKRLDVPGKIVSKSTVVLYHLI